MVLARDTKSEILQAALELFSTNGYEATSISAIAETVGLRKASLYSHFASKQEILDSLINKVSESFDKHSILNGADWNDAGFTKRFDGLTAEKLAEITLKHVRFIAHDPIMIQTRKLLAIEQFRNEDLAALQQKHVYDDVMEYHTGMFAYLISKGVFINEDPVIMAAQFSLPVNIWINLIDTDAGREKDIIGMVREHINQFWAVYSNK